MCCQQHARQRHMRKPNDRGHRPREKGELCEGGCENGIERVQRGIENVAQIGDIDAGGSSIRMVAVHEKDDGGEQKWGEG